jgi:hypothetical protein
VEQGRVEQGLLRELTLGLTLGVTVTVGVTVGATREWTLLTQLLGETQKGKNKTSESNRLVREKLC